jgi:hypothetical protein
MMMESNVGTIIFSTDEDNNFNLVRIEPDTLHHVNQILHPYIINITHGIVTGSLNLLDEEDKNTVSEETFKKLESCNEISNCAICLENKKLNIKLKCGHVFCKPCIKKWLTQKSNTCPTCRLNIDSEIKREEITMV